MTNKLSQLIAFSIKYLLKKKLYKKICGLATLFYLTIEKLNKDDDDNIINSVILNHDLIKVWTNLDNDIKRMSFTYNNASYIIKFNEE